MGVNIKSSDEVNLIISDLKISSDEIIFTLIKKLKKIYMDIRKKLFFINSKYH